MVRPAILAFVAVIAAAGPPATRAAEVAGAPPPAGPGRLSFKDVAAQGGAIVMARCITDGHKSVACEPIEAWRGTAPKHAIDIALAEWEPSNVVIRDTHPEGRFLLIVQPKREAGCVAASPVSGGRLRRVGNVDTCVVPIIAGVLPKEFRRWFDHTDGPSLSIDQLKAALLHPSRSAFIDNARGAACADVRNRLFLVDGKLVFWDRAGSCPDNAYGVTLFGDTVADVLCYFGDSIMGPVKRCPVAGYEAMFETMTTHSGDPDLGLGPGHTVEVLPL